MKVDDARKFQLESWDMMTTTACGARCPACNGAFDVSFQAAGAHYPLECPLCRFIGYVGLNPAFMAALDRAMAQARINESSGMRHVMSPLLKHAVGYKQEADEGEPDRPLLRFMVGVPSV